MPPLSYFNSEVTSPLSQHIVVSGWLIRHIHSIFKMLQGPIGDTGATGTAGSRGPKGRDGRLGSEGERGEDGDLVK